MKTNMHRVNMDKFVSSYGYLKMFNDDNPNRLEFRVFRSGDVYYIIKEIGISKNSHIIWSLAVTQTRPKIAIHYSRFDDKAKMPTKKIWYKKECSIEDIIGEFGYNEMALETYYSLTMTQFLFNNFNDGFLSVNKLKGGNGVLKGGKPQPQ